MYNPNEHVTFPFFKRGLSGRSIAENMNSNGRFLIIHTDLQLKDSSCEVFYIETETANEDVSPEAATSAAQEEFHLAACLN